MVPKALAFVAIMINQTEAERKVRYWTKTEDIDLFCACGQSDCELQRVYIYCRQQGG